MQFVFVSSAMLGTSVTRIRLTGQIKLTSWNATMKRR